MRDYTATRQRAASQPESYEVPLGHLTGRVLNSEDNNVFHFNNVDGEEAFFRGMVSPWCQRIMVRHVRQAHANLVFIIDFWFLRVGQHG